MDFANVNVLEWAAVFVIVGIVLYNVRKARGQGGARTTAGRRAEALFVSMFPELQPHFHPERVIEFVRARQAKTPPRGGRTVRQPRGFAAAASAEVAFDDKGREQWRLLDAGGGELARFRYEEHREGAALRVGDGKLTVNLQDKARPWVRYWHPQREFKWKQGHWTFDTRMSDTEIESSPSGTSFSDSGSSTASASSSARAAAAAAGVAAGAGTFDGGGASAAWDGGGDSGSGGADGGSDAFAGASAGGTAY